jgi:hypothetical protein
MAVFTGVALAPLVSRFDPRNLFSRRFDLELLAAPSRVALAAGMIVYGTWIIGSLLYPVAMTEIRLNSAPFKAIKKAGLRNAVVVFGRTAEDAADLTQNLATDPNPDVIYLLERAPDVMACGRRLYPDRKWYRVAGIEQVEISPMD